MANPDRPNGFTPVKSLNGGAWTAHVRRVQMADTSADSGNNHGDIYLGDPIVLSSGLAIPFDSNDADCVGVVVGVGVTSSGNPQNEAGPFNPDELTERFGNLTDSATKTIQIYYAPARDTVFEAQSDADLDLVIGSPADVSTDAGEAHGSRVTSRSTAEIVTNVNSDLKVVEIPEYPDNDSTLANTRYWVIFSDALNEAVR